MESPWPKNIVGQNDSNTWKKDLRILSQNLGMRVFRQFPSLEKRHATDDVPCITLIEKGEPSPLQHLYKNNAKMLSLQFYPQCFQTPSTMTWPMTYQNIHLHQVASPLQFHPILHVYQVVSTGHFTTTTSHQQKSTRRFPPFQLSSQTSRLSISTSCKVRSKSFEHATCRWFFFFRVIFSCSKWDDLVEEGALKTNTIVVIIHTAQMLKYLVSSQRDLCVTNWDRVF